jgi:hypothetical protein
VAHPICEPYREEQRRLLAIVYEPVQFGGDWPVWDYIARRVRKVTDADPLELISSLPSLSQPYGGPGAYRPYWTKNGGPFADSAEPVGLSIAGMAQLELAQAKGHVHLLVGLIAQLAEWDAAVDPKPYEVTSLVLPLCDVIDQVRQGQLAHNDAPNLVAYGLSMEPPLWGAVRPDGDGSWNIHLDQRLASFVGVADVAEYLDRLVTFMRADVEQTFTFVPALAPPLGLAEALGYLDAVWQARFRERLLGVTRPAAVTKLAYECFSIEEFESRLSALADVLGQFTVALYDEDEQIANKLKERSLGRLKRRLHRELPADVHDRVDREIKVLQTAIRIRVGSQHTGAQGELAKSFGVLGIRYPPIDPATAWQMVRSRVTAAVDSLRQELEATSVGP